MSEIDRTQQAEMLESFAEKIGRFWSPLALDMQNNTAFAQALRDGAQALRSSLSAEETTDQGGEQNKAFARSDQPQLRAGEADPRGDQRGGSMQITATVGTRRAELWDAILSFANVDFASADSRDDINNAIDALIQQAVSSSPLALRDTSGSGAGKAGIAAVEQAKQAVIRHAVAFRRAQIRNGDQVEEALIGVKNSVDDLITAVLQSREPEIQRLREEVENHKKQRMQNLKDAFAWKARAEQAEARCTALQAELDTLKATFKVAAEHERAAVELEQEKTK